ncbi:TPA: hypothetical protein ACLBZ1_003405 [Bacillus cereus]
MLEFERGYESFTFSTAIELQVTTYCKPPSLNIHACLDDTSQCSLFVSDVWFFISLLRYVKF